MKRSRLVVLALLLLTSTARGQWVAAANDLSAAAAGESLSVIRGLNDAVRKSPNDAALRFRVGSIAWLISVRAEAKPPLSGVNVFLMRALADSSLRLAAQLDTKNPQYELVLSRFLRSSSDPILRVTAPVHAERSIGAARAKADTATLKAALAEAGRLSWLAYESETDETPYGACPGVSTSIAGTGGDAGTEVALKLLHNSVASCMRPAPGGGEIDYIKAEQSFREAYVLSPDDSVAFRHMAMALAERNRWAELISLARDRTKRHGNEGWAWLALGLAYHRNGESPRASAALDTAMIRLPADEQRRLFNFTRILGLADSAGYVNAAPSDRKLLETSFWAAADPLWSREGNDPRTEFLARVTQAELRWTVEEYHVRGADSDRGQIFIRYGPPDGIWNFRCPADIPCGDGTSGPPPGNFMSLWDYDIGLTLVFYGAPSYGTAHFPPADLAHIDNAIGMRPTSFDNVAAEKILPMPLRILRFRATADSVDLFVSTKAPMQDIRAITANAPVTAHSYLLGRGKAGLRDSNVVAASGIRRAIYRVVPSNYMYRVEATAPGTLVAGRATGWIVADRDSASGFTLTGFGISDLLLAPAGDPNAPLPARWRGLAVAPLIGSLPHGGNLDIIWENYEVGIRDGQAQYGVLVTLKRVQSRSGRVSAAILNVAGGAVGVDRKDDRISFSFDRAVPASGPVFVDRISVGLPDTPPGDYIVTLEITDKVTGRKTQRSTLLSIAPQ